MSEHERGSDKPRSIGLKAIQQARVERTRTKHGRITGRAWLIAISVVLAVVLGAWIFRDRSLVSQKEDLLAKQRAALTTVGAEWAPLRDRIEAMTVEATGPYHGDYVDPGLRAWRFRSAPGIYLRTRVDDARSVALLRKSAEDSGRDSFVGCLLRENNPSMQNIVRGDDAGSGWQDQPWNLRLAYRATHVLTDAWVDEVKAAEDEIHLRVFVQQYDKAKREEIPLTIDIIKRSQFYLFVLDEDVAEAAALAPDAGRNAGKITEQSLQQLPHPARVHLFDLRSGKEMLRLRRTAEADVRSAGEHVVRDPYTMAAVKRQVNNCALAQVVLAEIEATGPADADAGSAADASP